MVRSWFGNRSEAELRRIRAQTFYDLETQGVDRAAVCGGQDVARGMRRFRTRTLRKVNTEALMTATGQNIKRLLSFGRRGPEQLAQAAALRPPDRPLPDLAHRTFGDHRRKRRIDSRFSTGWLV